MCRLLSYVNEHNLKTEVIYINDGPGLLLGTMWRDYSNIEDRYPNQVKVLTLRMIDERLTRKWLVGDE